MARPLAERFEPSSPWMPAFMRVNPILDWTYGEVWQFLRYFGLPYCCLYDQGARRQLLPNSPQSPSGYTSLGSKSNTHRNPALRVDQDVYRPAYELCDYSLERAGRVESPKKPTTQRSS